MEYNFIDIERKWRKHWAANQTFKAEDTSEKPKYYVTGMKKYAAEAAIEEAK